MKGTTHINYIEASNSYYQYNLEKEGGEQYDERI